MTEESSLAAVAYYEGESLREAVERWRDELQAEQQLDPSLLAGKGVVNVLTMFLERSEASKQEFLEAEGNSE